jgi:hypothetical protein
MDPTKKQRVGYLIWFQGLDLGTDFLKQDIEVFSPYNNATKTYADMVLDATSGKATCTGVIESFSWAGGVGDPLCISAYVSAENGAMIAAKMKSTLVTTKVTKLAWWVCNFDEENKVWYEEASPKDPTSVAGQLNAPGGKDVRLMIAGEPTKVAPNIDVNVYNMYFEVIPAGNATYMFQFATSSKTNYVKNWGLRVGTNARAAMG